MILKRVAANSRVIAESLEASGKIPARVVAKPTLTDPEIYTEPWISAKQTFKLQLPKDLTIMGEDLCVPSETEAFNERVRNMAGTGSSQPK